MVEMAGAQEIGESKFTGVCRVLEPSHWQHLFQKAIKSLVHLFLKRRKDSDWLTIRKHVRDIKDVPGEEIVKQHHLLVLDFRADIPPLG